MDSLKSILIVDDDPIDVEMTLTALGEYHLANEIAVARDGTEALDFLYRRGPFAERPSVNPIVVLLDIKMPKVNGLQVLRQIKDDPQLRLIPIVIMTSSRESRDVRQCYELGVNAYVVKPVQFEDFVDTVMTQYKSCLDYFDNTCPGANNSPEDGYSQFFDRSKNGKGISNSLIWSTDITYNNH